MILTLYSISVITLLLMTLAFFYSFVLFFTKDYIMDLIQQIL